MDKVGNANDPIQTSEPELTIMIAIRDFFILNQPEMSDEHLELLKTYVFRKQVGFLGNNEIRFVPYQQAITPKKAYSGFVFIVSISFLQPISIGLSEVRDPDSVVEQIVGKRFEVNSLVIPYKMKLRVFGNDYHPSLDQLLMKRINV